MSGCLSGGEVQSTRVIRADMPPRHVILLAPCGDKHYVAAATSAEEGGGAGWRLIVAGKL